MIYEALFIKRFNPILNLQLVKPGITHHLNIFNWFWYVLIIEVMMVNVIILYVGVISIIAIFFCPWLLHNRFTC